MRSSSPKILDASRGGTERPKGKLLPRATIGFFNGDEGIRILFHGKESKGFPFWKKETKNFSSRLRRMKDTCIGYRCRLTLWGKTIHPAPTSPFPKIPFPHPFPLSSYLIPLRCMQCIAIQTSFWFFFFRKRMRSPKKSAPRPCLRESTKNDSTGACTVVFCSGAYYA